MPILDLAGPAIVANSTGLLKKIGIGMHHNKDLENRLRDWQGLTDAQLNYYAGRGGTDAEAANQIIASRRSESRDADQYRAALERASYAQLGPRFQQGLQQTQGRLAGLGPLADSGAATALRARLASGIYNAGTAQVTGGYANYLNQAMADARRYKYQSQLLKDQKKMQKKTWQQSLLGIAGGVGGALVGGPAGAYAGYNLGNQAGGYLAPTMGQEGFQYPFYGNN